MSRLLLSLAVVAFFVLCAAGMRLGWRNRQRRQSRLPELPAVPADPGTPLMAELTGVYVGTTTAGDWQDRIVVHGLGNRAATRVRLFNDGVLLDNAGGPLWIPADDLVDARADRALAGKAMGVDGLLVFRWRLGEHVLDSGVRGDDRDGYHEWITAVAATGKGGERS
ncbi:MAG TPA: transporter [Pseudonocardiaceae bacterium]